MISSDVIYSMENMSNISKNINLIEKYSKYNSVAKRFDLNPIISTGGKHLETLIRLKIQRVKI